MCIGKYISTYKVNKRMKVYGLFIYLTFMCICVPQMYFFISMPGTLCSQKKKTDPLELQ